MNLKFFRPHGLYALIMCYKPSDKLGMSDTLQKATSARSDGEGGKLQRASGTTRNELELPEAAPLIFPDLDAIPDENKPSTVKRAGAFLSDYYDRRAQANFVQSYPIIVIFDDTDIEQEYYNPNSKLNVDQPRKEFVSRYSDPNSPAVNGGIIGLVTGGKVPSARYHIQEARRRNKEGKPARQRRLLSEVS